MKGLDFEQDYIKRRQNISFIDTAIIVHEKINKIIDTNSFFHKHTHTHTVSQRLRLSFLRTKRALLLLSGPRTTSNPCQT